MRANGSSDVYTGFIRATDYSQVDVENDRTHNASFRVSASLSRSEAGPGGKIDSDAGAAIGVFVDKDVPAVDLGNSAVAPGESLYTRDDLPVNIRFTTPPIRKYEILVNGDFDTGNVPRTVTEEEAEAGYFDLAASGGAIELDFNSPANGNLFASTAILDETLDGARRGIHVAANGSQLGAYYFVSYGGRDLEAGILDVDERAMDLTKTHGHTTSNLFPSGKVSLDAGSGSPDVPINWSGYSAMSSVGWALAAATGTLSVPLNVAFGLATSITAYMAANTSTPTSHSAAEARISRYSFVVHPDGTQHLDSSMRADEFVRAGQAPIVGHDFGVAGQNDVVVGAQVIRYISLFSQVYATSKDFVSNVLVEAEAQYITTIPDEFVQFSVTTWAG